MRKHRQRGWLDTLFARRRPAPIRRPARTRLGVERCENRDLPSISIPLNGFTWTSIGPSPIAVGQSPGSPTSTGRVNDIAVDSNNPSIMYAAADTGGIWKTTDGGKTWTPTTDQSELLISQIESVARPAGDTVYGFTQDGRLIKSTNGMNTFTTTTPFPLPLTVTKLVVFVTNATDSTKDVLYASTEGGFLAFGGTEVAGIWRSVDGGSTWTRITNQTNPVFGQSLNPNALNFTDVATDPTNPNIVYAAVGVPIGDPHNGVYRSSNALSANPSFTLLIGGSSFLPGSTPGTIKVAVSPVLPSTIFAALALRADPRTGLLPLLGVFRSTDSGVNWTPVFISNPANQQNEPQNYMAVFG